MSQKKAGAFMSIGCKPSVASITVLVVQETAKTAAARNIALFINFMEFQ
jgi:hypothetical protein